MTRNCDFSIEMIKWFFTLSLLASLHSIAFGFLFRYDEEGLHFKYEATPYYILIQEQVHSGANTITFSGFKYKRSSDLGSPKITDNNITGLEPCTSYLVIANVSVDTTGLQFFAPAAFQYQEVINTTYEDPITDILEVKPSNFSIFLNWNVTNFECVDSFVVETEDIKVEDIRETRFVLDELEACTFYKVHLMTLNSSKAIVNDTELDAETSFAHPSPVTNITTERVSDKRVLITWSPPDVASACVEEYVLKYQPYTCSRWSPAADCNEQTQRVSKNTTELLLEHLNSCTRYTLTITANDDPESESEPIEFATEPSEGPGMVTNINVAVQQTIATVTWSPPNLNPECIKHYEVSVDNNTQTVNETLAIFAQLQPCGKYNAKIVTVDVLDRRSQEAERSFEMLKDKPTPVRNFVVNATSGDKSSSADVAWDPPAFGAVCVARYRVVAWVQNENNTEGPHVVDTSTESTRIKVSDLKACEFYDMEVTPEVEDGENGESKITPIDVPMRISLAPLPTSYVSRTSTTLTISTQNQDEMSVCRLFYARFKCSYLGNDPEAIKEVFQIIPIDNGMEKFPATLEGLVPNSIYSCSASLRNSAGWSNYSISVNHNTDEDFPSEPDAVTVTQVKNTSLLVTWEPPKRPNGRINLYRIYITLIGPKFKVPSVSECPTVTKYNQTFVYDNINERKHEIGSLDPYTEYIVQVAASNNAGIGPYSPPIFVTTLIAPSEQVTEFNPPKIVGPALSTSYNVTATFQWRRPCRSNGKLSGFELNFHGIRIASPSHSFTVNVTVGDADSPDKLYEWIEMRLKPEYNYTVTCTAVIQLSSYENKLATVAFVSPSGIPNTDKIGTSWGDLENFESPKPTENVVVTISRDVYDSDVGNIRYLAILLSQADCQDDPEPEIGRMPDRPEDWPHINTWDNASQQECISQYQTTPKKWNPSSQFEGRVTDRLTYTVGVEICPSRNIYCNGPLRPGTKYNVVLRVFTESGYSDTELLRFKTDELVAIMTVILSICAFLFGSFIVGLLILFRSRKFVGPYKFARSPTDEPLDVPTKNFTSYYAELCANDNEKMNIEYKKINLATTDLINMTNTAAKVNEIKNRYTDIYPFDSNRVLLDTSEGDSDYINASYINGYKHSKEYIATQGPKPETAYDFWRMVVQCEVEAIVMLTQLKEGDKVKCYEYFPKVNKEQYHDDISVKCTQEINYNNYKKRIFVVQKNNEIRTVMHYHFTRWPDHDCPRNPHDLIKFIKIIRNEHKSSTAPVIVHCSAGVGRTGTFIAADILMQRIKQEKKLNIYETVKQLRMQRVRMVQNTSQYVFLYKCALELVIKDRNWRANAKGKAANGHVKDGGRKENGSSGTALALDQHISADDGEGFDSVSNGFGSSAPPDAECSI